MNFVLVETDDDCNWSLKTGMYACQLFEEKKTAINLRDCIDDILMEVGCEPDDISITTDKGANIVAATSQKQQLTCMCHRLNTAQEIAWDIVTSQVLVLWQFGPIGLCTLVCCDTPPKHRVNPGHGSLASGSGRVSGQCH